MTVSSSGASDGEPSEAGDGGDGRFDDGELYTPPKLGQGLSSALGRPREWIFLVENRMIVALGLTLAIFGLLSVIEVTTSFSEQGRTPLFYTFGALIGGNFTLITIVISISQLVISRQLGSPGDLRSRIEETNEYREAVEEGLEREVAPVTPTDFLQMLLEQTQTQLDTVNDRLEGVAAPASDELEDLSERLETHIEHVTALLGRTEVGLFEALSVTLQTNYSQEIYEIRDLSTEYAGEYPDEIEDALDELVVRLEQIDIARQYLKTLYMQDELAKMSRLLLYTGLPAVLTAVVMMHQFAASTRAILAPATLSALVPLALTVGVAPLTVLFAFVLRISMVAQRTVAITPFTTPTQEGTVNPGRLVEDESISERSGATRSSADD